MPLRSQILLCPSDCHGLRDNRSMPECVQGAAHSNDRIAVIIALMLTQPAWIIQHGKPPFVQNTPYGFSNFISTDELNQRFRVWSLQYNPIFSNDMPLDDPVTAKACNIKLSLINRGAGLTI